MPSFNISPFSCAKLELAISDNGIQLFFSMPRGIQPLFKCGSRTSFTNFFKILPYKELKMTKNIADKLKAMELIQIYLIFKNKITITKISLHFFRFFLKIYPPGSGSAY